MMLFTHDNFVSLPFFRNLYSPSKGAKIFKAYIPFHYSLVMLMLVNKI